MFPTRSKEPGQGTFSPIGVEKSTALVYLVVQSSTRGIYFPQKGHLCSAPPPPFFFGGGEVFVFFFGGGAGFGFQDFAKRLEAKFGKSSPYEVEAVDQEIDLAMGQNLWLHVGVDEHPLPPNLMFTRGTGF